MKKIGSFLAFITWLALTGVLFYFFFGFWLALYLEEIILVAVSFGDKILISLTPLYDRKRNLTKMSFPATPTCYTEIS